MMLEFPAVFMMIVIAAVIFVVVTTASQHRRNTWLRGMFRTCRSCGASHPPTARFCRRCGRQL